MITLTQQELIELFDAGRRQGSNEASSYSWGSRTDTSAKEAFIDALQEILYDRNRANGLEICWPDVDTVKETFGLNNI